MAFDLLTPHDLIAVQQDNRLEVSTSTWRNMFFRAEPYYSPQGDISIAEVLTHRTIAPFVLPTMAGKPILKEDGVEMRMFRPAYTKVKDPFRPAEATQMTPEEIARIIPTMTPAARMDRKLQKMLGEQKQAVEHLIDWMAATALIRGSVRIVYRDDFGNVIKDVTVAYDRDASHVVTKVAGTYWTDAGVDPIDDLETYINRVATAKLGGRVTNVVMGAKAATAFRKNAAVKDKLDMNYKGAEEIMVRRGLVVDDPLNPFQYIGTLGNGVNLWSYTDVAPVDDALKDVLKPHEIICIAPSNENIMCYGAIQDADAGLVPLNMFAKMWKENDPSEIFVMTQSAPLPIIGRPNQTLLAAVVAE